MGDSPENILMTGKSGEEISGSPFLLIFIRFCQMLFVILALSILMTGLVTINNGKIVINFLFLLGFGFCIIIALKYAPVKLCCLIKKYEWLIVIIIIISSIIIRVWIIKIIPVIPESDFRIYYETAEHIKNGTLIAYSEDIGYQASKLFSNGFDINFLNYSDYIAKFPHVFAYPFVLSVIFRIFGTSIKAAQYFGIFTSLVIIILSYRIIKMIAGSVCAILGAFIIAFCPSMIFYNSILGAESLFTAMFMGCILIFFHIIQNERLIYKIILGIVAAFTSAVRPMGIILLCAIVICLFIKNTDQKHLRYLGIISCIIAYGFTAKAVTYGIEESIGVEVCSGTVAFGSSFIMGTNVNSTGGWNQEDFKFLFDSHNELGSATKAQEACITVALERISGNIPQILCLMIKKYIVLWANDSYAVSWIRSFLYTQGNLSNKLALLLTFSGKTGNLIYIAIIFLLIIEAYFLIRSKIKLQEFFLVLLILGTIAVHFLLEVQNRYHYHMLPLFIILAVAGLKNINIHKMFSKK